MRKLYSIPGRRPASGNQVWQAHPNGSGWTIKLTSAAVPAVDFVFSFGQAGLFVQAEDITRANIGADPAAITSFSTHLNLHITLL
jgi:hypothetical protein